MSSKAKVFDRKAIQLVLSRGTPSSQAEVLRFTTARQRDFVDSVAIELGNLGEADQETALWVLRDFRTSDDKRLMESLSRLALAAMTRSRIARLAADTALQLVVSKRVCAGELGQLLSAGEALLRNVGPELAARLAAWGFGEQSKGALGVIWSAGYPNAVVEAVVEASPVIGRALDSELHLLLSRLGHAHQLDLLVSRLELETLRDFVVCAQDPATEDQARGLVDHGQMALLWKLWESQRLDVGTLRSVLGGLGPTELSKSQRKFSKKLHNVAASDGPAGQTPK